MDPRLTYLMVTGTRPTNDPPVVVAPRPRRTRRRSPRIPLVVMFLRAGRG